MSGFLQLPASERRSAIARVAEDLRLHVGSVEKDFWVCWTLRALMGMPGVGERLTFKGGTSLSKAWNLLRRFSEDLDLVVDRQTLGFGGDLAPEAAASGKQRE